MEPLKIGYISQSRDMKQAYSRIVSSIFMLKERQGMYCFAFTGCEGQVGNTTISITLAAELAVTGRKTLLVDCDFLKPAEEKRLYQYVDLGLSEYLDGNAPIEKIIYKTDLPNLSYISGGNQITNPTVMLWSEKFNEFMETVRQDFEFIIFDASPVLAAPEVCVLSYRVSGTILTVQCGRTKKTHIMAAKKEIESMKQNFIGVIVNKTPHDEYKIYQKNHGFSAIIRGPQGEKNN